jgi:MIP family channel proteins
LVGTFFLVFFITSVATLFVATGNQAQFGSDFAVVGLVNGFVLFGMIQIFGGVSGGHFNPAVTVAVAAIRRIDPIDALVYILAQLSGAVLGALLTKALLVDEGRAGHYGAAQVSALLGSNFQGFIVEGIGALVLVLAVLSVAMGTRAAREWAPFAIGTTLAFAVMVTGPLTGGSLNPARWFGPALVDNTWGGVWPYLLGPLVAAGIGAVLFRFVIEPGEAGLSPPPGQSGSQTDPSGGEAGRGVGRGAKR